MPFIVKWHRANHLREWDHIWGPVWAMSPNLAKRFDTAAEAQEAADTAVACMKPVPWRVPDFGFNTKSMEVIET